MGHTALSTWALLSAMAITPQWALAQSPVSPTGELRELSVSVSGMERVYYDYVPRGVPRHPAVIYVLHPNGVSASVFARQTGWTELADQHKFVPIFLQATKNTWNVQSERVNSDVAYAIAVIEDTQNLPGGQGNQGSRLGYAKHYTRRHLTGYREGASVARELQLRYPNLFASYAEVANPATSSLDLIQRASELPVPSDPRIKNKDVPVSVWVLQDSAEKNNEVLNYWKRVGEVDAFPRILLDGTKIFSNALNPAIQVRVTTTTRLEYDQTLSEKLWGDFTRHFRRWSHTLSGELRLAATVAEMGLLEVNQSLAGAEREWFEYVPSSYDGSAPVPLWIYVHGGGNTGDMAAERSEMYKVAEARGFIAVFPTGAWQVNNDPQNNTQEYLLSLLEVIKAKYNIDHGRVYMSGFSMGSSTANIFALRNAAKLAALAPFAGGWLTLETDDARQAFAQADTRLALPVWMWFSDLDPNSARADNSSVVQAHWKRLNGSKVAAESSPGHFGKDASYIESQGRFTTYIYPGTRGEFRASIVKDMPHHVHYLSCWKIWDEFLAKYRRRPDGEIVVDWWDPPAAQVPGAEKTSPFAPPAVLRPSGGL